LLAVFAPADFPQKAKPPPMHGLDVAQWREVNGGSGASVAVAVKRGDA
jgi:hypothetical protein